MTENKKMEKKYWLHAVTPLHVGAGRGIGYIDLPIAREKVTNWPYIPGSAVKGVIADSFNASEALRNDDLKRAAFGTANDSHTEGDAGSTAGSLVFTDARIACLPIRSFYGTFAWVTSPFCLERIKRDLKLPIPVVKTEEAIVTTVTKLNKQDSKVYLEDLDLPAKKSKEADECAAFIAKSVFADRAEWQEIFKERFIVVNDDIFTFLCEAGTEVNARIRIDENTGIVVDGALWYEEALPVETLLAGTVWCDRVYKGKEGKQLTQETLFDAFCSKTLDLQIGGKASTGKGRVRCLFETL